LKWNVGHSPSPLGERAAKKSLPKADSVCLYEGANGSRNL
jgi:hypothetical protein